MFHGKGKKAHFFIKRDVYKKFILMKLGVSWKDFFGMFFVSLGVADTDQS